MSALLDAALAAARRGWHVLPVFPAKEGACSCERGAECPSPGKHPLRNLVGDGQSSATTDEAQIISWWTRRPDASVAVVMRTSGLFALDVDLYHDDQSKLAALIVEHGPLPDTAEQLSGSGQGVHLIFRSPPFPTRGQLGGITCRGNNYILIAPSPHKSGQSYRWERDPDAYPPAELPEGWLAALRKPDPLGDVGAPSEDAEPEWLRAIPPEQRVLAMREHLRRERGERKGVDRGGTTWDVIRTCARGHAIRDPRSVLASVLELYNPRCDPPYSDDAISERIWKAYEQAHSPEWGAALEPRTERMRRELGVPVAAPGDLAPALAAVERSISRSSDPRLAVQGRVLGQVRRGEPLATQDDPADRADDAAFAVRAVVEHAPPATGVDELTALLLQSLVRCAPDQVRELVAAAVAARDLPPADDADLASRLSRGDKGPRACGPNVEKVLRWSDATRGQVRFDETLKVLSVGGRFAREKTNTLPVGIANWLDEEWGLAVSTRDVKEQLLRVAQVYGGYNPVADYLRSLTWDRSPRVDDWLVTYCRAEVVDLDGTDIAGYVRDVGSRWLVGAAARGLSPGVKMDTVLILEGRQGAKKSSAFRELGRPWATSTPIGIGTKDGLMVAGRRWICELAELASLVKSASEAQKAYLSAETDDYRPPYGTDVESVERRCVFGGTVNPEVDGEVNYLMDDTGDRRWWPVRVGGVIDLEALGRDRDQLWAEATFRYLSAELRPHLAHPRCPGERWWLEGDEQVVADRVAAQRHREDPWEDLVLDWARAQVRGTARIGAAKAHWTSVEVAEGALRIERRDLPRHRRDVNAALRRAGFRVRRIEEPDGGRPRVWSHPELSLPEPPRRPPPAPPLLH